jgi:hypothetical protein
MISFHNFLGECSKVSLLVNLFPKIRLRKDGQCIAGDLTAFAHGGTAHEMRYGLEFALGDDLERLAGLEGKTIFWHADFQYLAGTRAYVQSGSWIRWTREFRQRGKPEAWAGLRNVNRLVHEHGRCQSGQTSVINVSGAPVVFVRGLLAKGFFGRREVVEQPGFGDVAGLDDVLKITLGVAFNLLFGELIAGSGDETSNFDDQETELSKGGLKVRQDFLGRPHITRRVFWKGWVLFRQLGLYLSLGKVGTAIDVVGPLECIEPAVFELLFSARPADEPFGFGSFKLCYDSYQNGD